MIKGLALRPEVPDVAAVLRSLLGVIAVGVIAAQWGPPGAAAAAAAAAVVAELEAEVEALEEELEETEDACDDAEDELEEWAEEAGTEEISLL